MKYKALPLQLLIFLGFLIGWTGCSKDEEAEPEAPIVTSFSVIQQGSNLRCDYSTSGPTAYVELLLSVNGIPHSLLTSSSISPFTYSLSELSAVTGAELSFSLRAVGTNNKTSALYGPVNITIAPYCNGPENIRVIAGNLFWDEPAAGTNAFYQFQYGKQGFVLGEGTIKTTNETRTSNLTMEAEQVYEFYVRGYCNDAQQYSPWLGPFAYFSETNRNICTQPTNVGYVIEDNAFGEPVGARFTWADDGNNSFYEFNLVGNNQQPTSSAIESGSNQTVTYLQLIQNTEYDFYVRTKCVDGSYTNWVGPLNVNIGN